MRKLTTRYILTLFLSLLLINITFPKDIFAKVNSPSKSLNIEWKKNIINNKNDDYHCSTVIQSKDKGFFITGMKKSKEKPNLYFLVLKKLNSKGLLEWERTYGGYFWEQKISVVQNKEDGFVIVGTIMIKDGESNIYALKVDKKGNKVWDKKYSGKQAFLNKFGKDFDYDLGHYNVDGIDIETTKEGGYLLLAQNYSSGGHIQLIKLDENGKILWEKILGNSPKGEIRTFGFKLTKDQGAVIYGTKDDRVVNHVSLYDAYIIKVNSEGKEQWEKTFGGSKLDWFRDVKETKDGGFILTGGTESAKTSLADIYLVKIDSQGKKQWEKNYFGKYYGDSGSAVFQTNDGGFIVFGSYTTVWHGESKGLVLKVSSTGIQQWKILSDKHQYFSDSYQTFDGYISLGGTENGTDIVKFK